MTKDEKLKAEVIRMGLFWYNVCRSSNSNHVDRVDTERKLLEAIANLYEHRL